MSILLKDVITMLKGFKANDQDIQTDINNVIASLEIANSKIESKEAESKNVKILTEEEFNKALSVIDKDLEENMGSKEVTDALVKNIKHIAYRKYYNLMLIKAGKKCDTNYGFIDEVDSILKEAKKNTKLGYAFTW